jgi:thiamine biosynthesis lipoprotein
VFTNSSTFEAIGTQWVLECTDLNEKVLRTVHELIEGYDKNYSRFRHDSFITAMSHKAGTYTLPADAEPLLDMYAGLYVLTKGAVTPLIGQALSDAGYDASYSLKARILSKPPRWEEALEYVFPHITLKQPVLLDFGAAGKGYLVDLVAEVLQSHDIHDFCIDAGGDILCSTHEPQRIGLEHPSNERQVIGVAELSQGSICGSSGNRRQWEGFHHIIDPHTLASPTHIAATWAVADTALVADAMATALYFVPGRLLQEHYQVEYAVMDAHGIVEASAAFPAEFFNA